MSDTKPEEPTDPSGVSDVPTRRSSRAVARPNFRVMDGGDDEEADWSSDGDGDIGSQRRKRKGNNPTIRPSSVQHRNRQKKTVALDDLEVSVRQAEADIADLLPQAAVWKERYTSLVAENEALQKRIQELTNELARRDGKVGCIELEPVAGTSSLPPWLPRSS